MLIPFTPSGRLMTVTSCSFQMPGKQISMFLQYLNPGKAGKVPTFPCRKTDSDALSLARDRGRHHWYKCHNP